MTVRINVSGHFLFRSTQAVLENGPVLAAVVKMFHCSRYRLTQTDLEKGEGALNGFAVVVHMNTVH